MSQIDGTRAIYDTHNIAVLSNAEHVHEIETYETGDVVMGNAAHRKQKIPCRGTVAQGIMHTVA